MTGYLEAQLAAPAKGRYSRRPMPELPEVETICRGLAPRLVGRTFVRVEQRCEALRVPLPPRFAARIEGRTVIGVGRRAKYILIHLDDGAVIVSHLGMSGRLVVHNGAPLPPKRHDHVIFHTDDGVRLIYNDARRFGLFALARADRLDRHPLLSGLGPEPLAEGFTGAALAARLGGKRTPIKAALLDQRVVAGLGNIYACESLFRARLSPRRQAYTVAGRRAERLAGAIRAVLGEAIEAGGSSLRDYVQATNELGYFQHHFAVYDRAGSPCPGCGCGGAIRRIVQAGRSTFFCPRRQR